MRTDEANAFADLKVESPLRRASGAMWRQIEWLS
jgi:hypothetical protein